jgi:prolyl 3-hydroxylase /prolyl 3,4-dihydroxylase
MNKWINDHNTATLQKEFKKHTPFPHVVIGNFFLNAKIKEVTAALKKQQFQRTENDLYQFERTADFKSSNGILKQFYTFFSSQSFKTLITSITGEQLGERIDMAGFIYNNTDYLLPHDDRLTTRKIAFIINLSNSEKKDGGALELFNSKRGEPTTIEKSYPSRFNTLTLFKVSPISFHQVAEVINNKRYTITGWFHGSC